MYKQLTSRNFDFKNNQKEIESTITKISNIFIKENNQLVENAERKRKIKLSSNKSELFNGSALGNSNMTDLNDNTTYNQYHTFKPLNSLKSNLSYKSFNKPIRRSKDFHHPTMAYKNNINLANIHRKFDEVDKRAEISK